MRLKAILQNETAGWKPLEIIWLCTACLAVTIPAIMLNDKITGIIAAVCGVAAAVLTGKGKISCYVIGGIKCILYSIIAYNSKYYGEVMLNLLYFFPMEFYGIYVWHKNMNTDTHEVNKRRMNAKLRIITATVIAIATVVYGKILQLMGGNLPYVDAFTTVNSVVGMLVTIKMFAEQWVLWIIINIVSGYMWFVDIQQGNNNIAMLMMWTIYLINSVIMLIRWHRASKIAD